MNHDVMKKRIVVLISGNGSNLQALIDAIDRGDINAEIVRVISNKADAFGLERAENFGIQNQVVPFAPFKNQKDSRLAYDAELARIIKNARPDLIVLAGFMRILSSTFLDCFEGKVINLHPALPGAYPGINAIARAWSDHESGMNDTTGVMVHFVIPEVDAGPVIAKDSIDIRTCSDLTELETKIHSLEHRLIVDVVRTLCTHY